MAQPAEIRVPYNDLVKMLADILVRLGFEHDRAHRAACLFADASRDGVYSHGVNRFPRFVRALRNGIVDPHATPAPMSQFGALGRWDGRLGPGMLNPREGREKGTALSRPSGVGCSGRPNPNDRTRG